MSYRIIGSVIKQVITWLNDNQIKYALVGGLAVSFRTIERTTKDVDIVILVSTDSEAENIVRSFQSLGYQPDVLIEHSTHKTIATVRLLNTLQPSIYVDLLFASSGIEKEIVESSEPIEILKNLPVQLASISSLIAMKVLSADSKQRIRDIFDLQNLLKEATNEDLEEVERLLKLIEKRGYNRQKNLIREFKKYQKKFKKTN